MRELIPDQAKAAHADVMHRLRWRRSPQARITKKFVDTHGLTVMDGPFAGMRYPRYAVGRGELVVAQLLGAYERELQPYVQRVIDGGFDRVVDIGASDGYYAVGIALKSPQTRIVAYEMNDFPARVCRALAVENGVDDRVDLLEVECTTAHLAELPEGPRTFVLSDCEGGEAQLMDPDAAPVLRGASLIVELHEFAVPDILDTIRARFEATHEIEIVDSGPRYIGDYPKLLEVPDVTYVDREVGLREFRPVPMRWAVLEPRG